MTRGNLYKCYLFKKRSNGDSNKKNMGIGPFGDWEEGKVKVDFISQEFGAYLLVSRVKGFVGDSMHCLTLKIEPSRLAVTHFPCAAIFEVSNPGVATHPSPISTLSLTSVDHPHTFSLGPYLLWHQQ